MRLEFRRKETEKKRREKMGKNEKKKKVKTLGVILFYGQKKSLYF